MTSRVVNIFLESLCYLSPSVIVYYVISIHYYSLVIVVERLSCKVAAVMNVGCSVDQISVRLRMGHSCGVSRVVSPALLRRA